MTCLRLGAPVTMLYRGDLYDTASLVGLVNCRAKIGVIAFIGDLSEKKLKYLEMLNPWLRIRGFPAISVQGTLTPLQMSRLVNQPHLEWGWGDKECKAAIHFAGLPLPPSLSDSNFCVH